MKRTLSIEVLQAAFFVRISLMLFLTACPIGAQVYRVKEMNAEQIRSLDRQKTVVLLPGGILEEHGPYLPVFTDGYLSERVTEEVAQAIARRPGWKVLVLPLTPLGAEGMNHIGGKESFAGTFAVRSSTLRAVYMDLATELGEQGFRWILVIHVHGAGLHNRALDQASDYFHDTYGGQMVHLWGLVPVLSAWGQVLQTVEEKARREDGVSLHAGMDETSLMLFLRPNLVSPAYRKAPPLTGQSLAASVAVAQETDWPGYIGSPRLGNAALGARIWKALSEASVKHALEILDGDDPRKFRRYGDLLEGVPAYAEMDERARRHERETEGKQSAWLKARGLSVAKEDGLASEELSRENAIRSIIRVVEEADEAAVVSDVPRYVSALTPDAVYLPPNSQAKSGEELRAWHQKLSETFRFEIVQYFHDQATVAGDHGFHLYSYRWKLTPKAGGEAREPSGRGLHIFRRQPDGKWKIAVNIWNASPLGASDDRLQIGAQGEAAPNGEVLNEEETRRIVQLTEEEANAAAASDSSRYFGTLADDAVFLPPNLPVKRGEDLRGWLGNFLENFKVEWIQYLHDQTVIDGNFGYHRYSYHWKVTPKAGGETLESRGKGVHVLRRQSDGMWKIVVNIWNSNP